MLSLSVDQWIVQNNVYEMVQKPMIVKAPLSYL